MLQLQDLPRVLSVLMVLILNHLQVRARNVHLESINEQLGKAPVTLVCLERTLVKARRRV